MEPYEINQVVIPDSFMGLFLVNGRPTAAREEIEARYEACDDLANAVAEFCKHQVSKDVSEELALRRCYDGLLAVPDSTTSDEAGWVTRRVAELLSWEAPQFLDETG